MNSFNYEYPVRQHFGKECAESAIKGIGLPTRWNEIGITDDAVLRAADTCFLLPGCCKQMSRVSALASCVSTRKKRLIFGVRKCKDATLVRSFQTANRISKQLIKTE